MLQEELKQLRGASRSEIRKFGFVVGAVFLGLGAWFYFRHKTYFSIFFWIGTPLVVGGAIVPNALRPVYLGWMSLAVVLGHIVSTLLLTLLFYLVVFPVGLTARIAGKDFLNRKLDRGAGSYWIKKPSEPRNYEQQF
jgi:hypothetical protein